jgi:hypothetical protein
MSKKYGRWYGRPNKPPENWHTPDKPVVRSVQGWSKRGRDRRPPPDKPADADNLITVTLKVADWVTILKAFHLYSESRGDEQWKHWRLQLREAILGAINPHIHRDMAPVAVSLELVDWRAIWRCVQIVSQERGEAWLKWFAWLSQTMTAQITRDG